MTHPEIHIKISKPLPEKVEKVLSEKNKRRALYAKGDIKSIREKDGNKGNSDNYIIKGKVKKVKKGKSLRHQILDSMLASFRIEGIHIPTDQAEAALLKIELTLEK